MLIMFIDALIRSRTEGLMVPISIIYAINSHTL